LGEASEPRFDPSVVKEYANEHIVVRWEPAYCIHSGRCFMGLPEVFDPGRRPWVDVSGADADTLADTIQQCPTGALHFRRVDGGPQEEAPDVPTITETHNGPMYIHGRVKIVNEEGDVLREDTRVALCRCGGSDNKPFCDGTHRRLKFRSRPKTV